MSLAEFHPAVRDWFTTCVGTPTEPQVRGWPAIRSGAHVLIAAPTGTGKTLAAFLCAIDLLVREGPYLPDECRVLYVSPLRALSNDVQKNLLVPLAGIAERDALAPRLRVLVRTGDTPAGERQQMGKRPPHLLVTTPESLGILLTSAGGRRMLGTVRTVIIDEIHAVVPSKRGAYLSLCLERLEHLAGRPIQRIGLSATQKPLELIAHFLGGRDRAVQIVDGGHLRRLDLGIELPSSPLEPVVSHELWGEAYARLVELIVAHRTTLVFVPTRSMAERISLRLIERFNQVDGSGDQLIACHHGAMAKDRRLDAEQRLKAGTLRALVATATLELGIDIGEVDLVVQIGSARAIATFLQRVGRAGHGVGRTPKARIIALTPAELIEGSALLRAVRQGALDALRIPDHPWDVLAQHVVSACVNQPWSMAELHQTLGRAWPYRELNRGQLTQLVALHSQGRHALLHFDPATHQVRGTRRAKLVAITCAGAIPDQASLQVREDPGDLVVGSVDEDFALESSPGDIFQLGNTAWKILKVEGRSGVVRVQNAHGAPATIPFWFGEAPGRTRELSEAVGAIYADADSAAWFARECGINPAAALAAWRHLKAAHTALGQLPTNARVVAERFFDEVGTQHLVIHACFGTRITRAWGLALRKRFCTGFGFELEAAATDEGLVLSLGPTTSFAVDDVFSYLSSATLRATLIQACVTGGQFETRWRWASAIALLVERSAIGKRTPPHLLRIRANDALVAAFPGALTCPDNLPPGNLPVPEDHPIVAQVISDLLSDLMDLRGLAEVLTAIKDQRIAIHAVDVAEPSVLARGIISARPYAFLDDVGFEERRTRAISQPSPEPIPLSDQGVDQDLADRVLADAWPDPRSHEELHEVLGWIGFITTTEATPWQSWLAELHQAGRALCDDGRWFAVGVARDALTAWRGRLEVVLGPVVGDGDESPLLALEQQGIAMRVRIGGGQRWCHRRLFQRMLAAQRDRRRTWFQPVSISVFLRFLATWQGLATSADPATAARREPQRLGPAGTAETMRQLAGLELAVTAWKPALVLRVRDYGPDQLDDLTLRGELAWGRLWAAPAADADASPGAIRSTPISFIPRDELDLWLQLAGPAGDAGLSGPAREVLAVLRGSGASFLHELRTKVRQVPATIEDALSELVAAGLATCDSLVGLRWLLLSADRRKSARPPAGRWSCFRTAGVAAEIAELPMEAALLVARTLLRRTGVVFRKTWERERIRCPWRDVHRALRTMELRGEVVGGRFIAGFSGEQFAHPEVPRRLRACADASGTPIEVPASDPLNYTGLLVPGERVRANGQLLVSLG